MTASERCGLCLWIALLAGCTTVPRGANSGAGGGELSNVADRLILVTVANPPGPLMLEAGSTSPNYDAVNVYAGGDAARLSARQLAHAYGLQQIRAWPIAALNVECLVFAVPAPLQPAAVLSRLSADKRVRLAQPMQVFETLSDQSPSPSPSPSPASAPAADTPALYNDPYLDLQWGFAAIEAGAAQQWSRGEGVRVAIIDTGVDTHHPDLANRITVARNFVDGDQQTFNRDRHGTQVAGVIAAVANNRVGIVGVAPRVRLQVYKACRSPEGQSPGAQCNSFTLALALSAAIEARAQIVNLSLGGPADPLLTQLVADGQRRGMTFIGAAPPEYLRGGFPTGIAGVIEVDTMPVADAALRPVTSQTQTPAPLFAPGMNILSLTPGGHYDFGSGSSLAAAHVTGAVALLRARAPQLSAKALYALLDRSQQRVDDGAGNSSAGNVINLCAALAALQPQYDCPRSPRPVTIATQAR